MTGYHTIMPKVSKGVYDENELDVYFGSGHLLGGYRIWAVVGYSTIGTESFVYSIGANTKY